MAAKIGTSGTRYRDDAADLIEDEVELAAADAERLDSARSFAAPPVQPESRNPLPYPEPVGINDNLQRYAQLRPISERPRISVGRVIGWIVLSPWYATVAATSIGIDFLFVKSVLGF